MVGIFPPLLSLLRTELQMLTLKRRNGEGIIIDDRIRIVVTDSKHGACRISIDAPREYEIRREELPSRSEEFGDSSVTVQLGLPQ